MWKNPHILFNLVVLVLFFIFKRILVFILRLTVIILLVSIIIFFVIILVLILFAHFIHLFSKIVFAKRYLLLLEVSGNARKFL